MKTVFISILSGVEAKNILRTNILARILLTPQVRVVLFLRSTERVAFYQKEFHHPRLLYEVVTQYPFHPLNAFFEAVKHHLVRTKTLNLHKRLTFMDRQNVLVFVGSHLLNLLLANPLLRALSRCLDYHLARDAIFSSFFDRYHPDLVFLANLFEETEISFLREAKRRGVKTVGFINSWDKVTSKGFIRLLPDALIAPNLVVRDEAIHYDDVPVRKIFVSGVPQYDTYTTQEGIVPREAFFKRIKANSYKHLIVFGPMGRSLSNSDWEAIDMLREIVEEYFADRAELLVRFQPNDFGGDEEEFKKRPWLRYDIPGVRFSAARGTDWDMGKDDLLHLKNTLYHCSLLISYASSLSIDAACFDKLVINIGFEVKRGEPALKQPSRRFATEHYTKALRTGGVRLVHSKEELIDWIRRYLDDPALDREGRTRLVEQQCYRRDGKAGERMSGFLLGCLPDS